MINDLEEVQWAYLLEPTFQIENTAGKPLTDGWIEVFIHGTRTKYYCASDFDGTLHPFKIPLDSLGSNIILASPAHAYDVYVYNKFGSLVMSRYNVVPATGDGAVIKDVVNITSNDNTVTVASQDQTNWDLSIKDTVDRVQHNEQEISNVKVDIENANNNITNLTEVVNNHTTEIGQIKVDVNTLKEDVAGIESSLTNKKDKQPPKNFNGSATKTVKNITQNANGELTVEFADIDLPQEVPNVEITSDTLDVSTTVDVQTNTKTFKIELEGSNLDYYNAGKDNGTVVNMNNDSMWLPLANSSNLYGSYGITMNSEYTRAILDSKKKYICCAEICWEVNSYNIANTIARLSLNYQIGTNTNNPFMYIDIDMSRENSGRKYVTWLTEGADWTGIYAGLDNNYSKIVSVSIKHFFAIEQGAIIGGQGGGSGDNDKVAIDANAVPGYLEDVLVSDSDIVTLVKFGNKLHVQVNTASTADPKLATCDEAVINGATNNYGSYALANGYDKLIWNDPNSYSWLNANAIQMKRLCTSQGTVTKCNLALCGSLSLTTPPAFINCAIFNTSGILLGSTGLRLYGTDFFSGSELVSFDMSEAIEGALKLKNNTYYIIQIVTCGLQLASLSHADSYNYNYDYDLRMNLQGTTSELNWKDINALTERASQIPWISFAASPNV